MKKFMFAAVAAFAIFALVGCGGDDSGGGGGGGVTTEETWTIEYAANGWTGTGVPEDSKTVVKGSALSTVTNALPTLTTTATQVFRGWSLTSGQTGDPVQATYKPTANITLNVLWNAVVEAGQAITITYHAGTWTGGNLPSAGAGISGTALTGAELPTIADSSTQKFLGWALTIGGTVLTTAYVPNSNLDLYVVWETISVTVPEYEGLVEEVWLKNSFFVVYQFTPKAGKTWADYENITVDYMLDQDTLDNGIARAVRLFGNLVPEQHFKFLVGTGDIAGRKFAIADYNAIGNGEFIMAHLGGGYSNIMKTTLEEVAGEVPLADTWFTVTYNTEGKLTSAGGVANNSYKAENIPANDSEGPFYFGIGLPGQDNANKHLIGNVTLVGFEAEDSVQAIPAVFKLTNDSNALYPAFVGYGTAGGGDGVKEASRESIGTITADPIAVTLETFNISLKYNYPSAYTGDKQTDVTLETDWNRMLDADDLVVDPITGYLFQGWFTAASGGTRISSVFAADMDIFAQWKEGRLPTKAEVDAAIVEAPAFAPNATNTNDVLDDADGPIISYEGASRLISYEMPASILLDGTSVIAFDKMTVTYIITKTEGDFPVKLGWKPADTASNWSGNANQAKYVDINADGETTVDFDPLMPNFNFLNMQDNGMTATKFTIQITKVQFFASETSD